MLETFGDEWLGIYALHDRWNHEGEQREFAAKDFGKTSVPNGINLPSLWATDYFICRSPGISRGQVVPAKQLPQALKKVMERRFQP